jgi:DNA-binding NarL/FixJ family response regulator
LTQAIDREPDLLSVGHATTGAGGVAMFAELRPDIVLMDLQLPDFDGTAAAAQIVALSPEARVIMLTAHVTAAMVANAAASGACGFLPKDGHLADMLSAIRAATRGSLAVDPALMARLTQLSASTPSPDRPLSQRELSVLLRMADGQDVARIARALFISSHTCRGHVKNVLSKLGAHSQLEAVVIAVRMGLIEISDEPGTVRAS